LSHSDSPYPSRGEPSDTVAVFTANNYDQKVLLGKLKRILDPDMYRGPKGPFG
jgi:hypothetical protein